MTAKTKPELLTAEELAAELRAPIRTIYEWSRRKVIPCYRGPRLLRFDLAKVLAALEEGGLNGKA